MNQISFLSEDVLENVAAYYTTIIVEGDNKHHKNQNIIFVDQDSKYSLDAVVSHYCHQDGNVLVIMGTSSIDQILLATQDHCNITILNTAAGLSAFGTRGTWDHGDLNKAMSYGFEVYDPYCIENLMQKLSTPWNKRYIRTNTHLLSADQYPTLKAESKQADLYNLKWLGFSGSHGTLLGLWSSILDLFHANTLLQEKWELMDCFVCTRSDIVFCESLIASIRETEHLWIIADQHNNPLWEQNIKAKLWDLGLFETDIHIIWPRLGKVTSFLDEYVYEQAEFDGPGIAGRIVG